MSRDDFDPTKTPGTFGQPPPDAPRESAMPLTDDSLSEALARAAANEQTLEPFNPQPGPTPVTRMGVSAPKTLHAPPRTAPQTHQPAASETDSPSRGIPREVADPGRRITGGFGHAGEAQYFPLDGTELRELVLSQFDQLAERLQNDLRFHIAITYPRVRVRVVVEVEAYAQENGFTVERIKEHDKTPLEVARDHADQVAFVLIAERREVADDGSAENPPDRVREELGLARPHKQQIDTPGGRMFVDRPSSPLDSSF